MRLSIKSAAAALLAVLLAGCGGREETDASPPGSGGTDFTAHFFEAGKADAILLTTAESAVLVDTGEKGFGKTVVQYLAEQGIERLDYLVITHFDQDHVGGAAKILNSVQVGTVLQSARPKDSEEYEKYIKALENAQIEPVTVRETYSFRLDGVEYRVDPPCRTQYSSDNSNNSSLILSVRNGTHGFLLMGDAQTERLEEFLEDNRAEWTVLKVPHHGKEEPLMETLAESVSPALAVITSSEEEPESSETVAALERAGAKVLLTREGSVTLQSDGTELRVTRGG